MNSVISLDYLRTEIKPIILKSPSSLHQKVHDLIPRMLKEMSTEEILHLECLFKSQAELDCSLNSLLTAGVIEAIITEVKKAKILQEARLLLKSFQLDDAELFLHTYDDPRFKSDFQDLWTELALFYRLRGENEKADRVEACCRAEGLESGFAQSDLHILKNAFPEENIHLPTNDLIDQALESFLMMLLSIARLQLDPILDQHSSFSLQERLAAAEMALEVENENYDEARKTEFPNIFIFALRRKYAVVQEILKLRIILNERGVLQAEKGDIKDVFDSIIKQASEDLMKALLQASGVPLSEIDEEMPDECKIS